MFVNVYPLKILVDMKVFFFSQRPTAKELLKFQFIKKAKKNSYLIDLIDRYKKWKTQKGEESETESENSDS